MRKIENVDETLTISLKKERKIMPINVKKLDGTLEPLDVNKILRWGHWAGSESPDISFESVLTFTATAFYDGVSTSEITAAICRACEDLAKAASDEEDYNLTQQYNSLARNLYIPSILKKANHFQAKHMSDEDVLKGITYPISNGNVVPLQRFKIKSLVNVGVDLNTYDPELLDGTITDELFNYADEIIDYTRMNLHPYGGLRQIEEKYLRRSDGNLLEDPQQLFILMSLAATHSDIKTYPNGSDIEFQKTALLNYYQILSTGEMNSPTPFLLSLRTDFKQYDSCCVKRGTLIDTTSGVVAIEDLTSDYQVYNERGEVVSIISPTSRKYAGNMYTFKTKFNPTDETYFTGDHKLRVKQENTLEYEWKESKDIQIGDYLYYPKMKENLESIFTKDFIHNPSYKVLNDYISKVGIGAPSSPVKNIDLKNNEAFFRILGYFAGDGHTMQDRHVLFTLGRAKEYIDDIVQISEDVFGITPRISSNEHLDNTVHVKIHSTLVKNVFSSIIGNNSSDKADFMNFIQSASLDCIRQFVIGYFRTDGCAFSKGYTLSSCNKSLILILKQCLVRLGYSPSISRRSRITNYSNGKESVLYNLALVLSKTDELSVSIGRDIRKLTLTETSPRDTIFTSSGCFVRVKGVSTNYLDDTVYDIAVDCDTHSFTIDGLAVHNCLFSIGDENNSIKAGMSVAMEATVAGAGVGVSLGRIRSKGTRFRKMGKHQGVLGYLGQLTKTVKASNQECYSDDTELLTDKGFILFSELTPNHLVAQVEQDRSITFVVPSKFFVYDYKGPMVELKTKRNSGIDLLVTPNHNLVYKQRKDLSTTKIVSKGFALLGSSKVVAQQFTEEFAIDFNPSGSSVFYTSGYVSGTIDHLTPYERLLIAFQADGVKDYPTNDLHYTFHLKRKDKVDRLYQLIEDSGVNSYENKPDQDGSRSIRVQFKEKLDRHFSYDLLKDKSSKWCREFIDELRHWDGSPSDSNNDSFVYSSVHKQDSDFVQAVASQAGVYTNVYVSKPHGNRQPCYVTSISFEKTHVLGSKLNKSIVDYDGKVYCVEVPTNKLVVRRNFKTAICGNSRGGGATVNFPLWTRDIYDLLMLKDVTGVEGENRYRHLDYCFHFSMYLVEKLRKNEKILLVSPNTLVAPGVTVYDAFYKVDGHGNYDPSLFNAFCEMKLKDTTLPYLTNTNSATLSAGTLAYTKAYDLFSALVTQMVNTGRMYTFNVDNVNNHSAFLDPVEMTNLC